ncbi:hypothetical protein GXW78_00795 [Roseomonas terrae]|jgi:hypothetical protein|uniref:Lipoprotein n=1 Tax=Neoroseomonas terrae TaxID=424799 RepID=A0ABS5EB53_9PROT|nr:hypothetical protein [Neoroseomonas terrae]MBR0648185.1 hypothetical protein [Neoroseomonas terrae]
MRLGSVLLLLPALAGCATAALNASLRAANPQPAWNGETAIASDPAGAQCAVHRGDRQVASVPAAPGTVQLPRSHAVLEVRCQAEGFLETAVLMRPADDPAVFRMAPNGIIGATATVFSLASARTMRYPGQITVAMVPAVFATDEMRSEFFEGRRQAILASRAAQLALADERCRAQPDSSCDPAGLVMRSEQDEDLARLDRLRRQARLASDAPAAP